ncbi:unnamed protein product, partial [Amoebophrya sp. A25]
GLSPSLEGADETEKAESADAGPSNTQASMHGGVTGPTRHSHSRVAPHQGGACVSHDHNGTAGRTAYREHGGAAYARYVSGSFAGT